ncbi:protein FAM53A-like [Liolophura sinensis]|uniref:protein FAM53A-like n=1 Tax=Liolophura sinensis TaxID=3198878 RepID=UPI0031589669
MLAMLTERLQNQRLDDIHAKTTRSNIELITAQGINFTGTKTAAKSPDSSKKLWFSSHDGKKRCVNRYHGGSEGKGPGSGYGSLGQPILCYHRRPVQTCATCSAQSSSATPPKKKHCRSLSIPADTATGGIWRPQGSKLWKPIAVCPVVLHPKQHKTKPYSPNLGRDLRANINSNNLGRATPQDMGYITPCDLATPPESPIPRPASASSGYCDGSFSPIGAPWLDCSPSRSYKSDSFKKRSVSLEDRISGSTTLASVLSCIHSTPSSPCHHRIPRCRSQPCVLHDRKCGLKRRRDYDRPTLDLHKMAETAYPPEPAHHLAPPTTRFTDYKSMNTAFRPSRFREELQSAISLVPIASSPLDTDIPIKAMESPKASPIKEMGRFSRLALSEDSGCSEVDEIEECVEECPCSDSPAGECAANTDLFPIADLDVEEIESH